jgi:hypothetical protein
MSGPEQAQQNGSSGTNWERLRDCQPDRLRGLDIDDRLVLRRLLRGQVGWFGAFKNFARCRARSRIVEAA